MAAPTLSWTLNTERGTIAFGRLLPFAGNTYDFSLAGTVYGQTYTAYVMSDDGLRCLAKSSFASNKYSIAFNTKELRDEFLREMHEMRTFHCVVRDTEKCVAEGDLTIAWNPLWTDVETGEVYTMRGPQGKPGEPGKNGGPGKTGMSAYDLAVLLGYTGTQEEWIESLRGQPGNTIMVQGRDFDGNPTDNWYKVYAKQNYLGEWRMVLDQTPYEYDPDTNDYVLRTGPQTIDGQKTFTTPPVVPTIEKEDDSEDAEEGTMVVDTDDDSTKAANTHWVTEKISAWWNSIIDSAILITGLWRFRGLVVEHNEGTAVLSVDPETGKTSVSSLEVVGDSDFEGDVVIRGDTRLEGALDYGEGVFDLFETKWLDYAKPDEGKWRKYRNAGFSRTDFKDAYDHLVQDLDGGTTASDIVSETLNIQTPIAQIVIRDGIARGFNADKDCYIESDTTITPGNTPWMLQMKFKSPDAYAADNHILALGYGLLFKVSTNGLVNYYLGNNGSSYNIASEIAGSHAISVSSWAWIRCVFDGTKYVFSVSNDGINFSPDAQVISSAAILGGQKIRLGGTGLFVGSLGANGEIDLRDTWFKYYPGEESEVLEWEASTRSYLPYTIAQDGHKIVDVANKGIADEAFSQNGIAWYWIVDRDNLVFYVPRTKWGFTGERGGGPGAEVKPGLPDISHTHDYTVCNYIGGAKGNGISASVWINNFNQVNIATTGNTGVNKIYGSSETVQPPATEMFLYFYLGR